MPQRGHQGPRIGSLGAVIREHTKLLLPLFWGRYVAVTATAVRNLVQRYNPQYAVVLRGRRPPAVPVACEHIQVPVGARLDVAQPAKLALKQRLVRRHGTVGAQLHHLEGAPKQRRHKVAALPLGYRVGLVELGARRGPRAAARVERGVLVRRPAGAVADYDGPAVVSATLDHVYLVVPHPQAPGRPVLRYDHAPVIVPVHALRVSVAHRVHERALPRVVGGGPAVAVHAQYLSGKRRCILRQIRHDGVTRGRVQHAVGPELYPAPVVPGACRYLVKYDARVAQPRGAGGGGSPVAAAVMVRIALYPVVEGRERIVVCVVQVYVSVVLKVRIDCDPQQAGLRPSPHADGQHGLGLRQAVPYDTDGAAPLGEYGGAVRKPVDAPGHRQPVRDGLDADAQFRIVCLRVRPCCVGRRDGGGGGCCCSKEKNYGGCRHRGRLRATSRAHAGTGAPHAKKSPVTTTAMHGINIYNIMYIMHSMVMILNSSRRVRMVCKNRSRYCTAIGGVRGPRPSFSQG